MTTNGTAQEAGPRVEHRVVVVTGAASGIGRAASEIFARQGATVVAADINAAAGNGVVAQITARGGSAYFLETDVASRASCERTVASVLERSGHLDVLVSNAGIYPLTSLDEMTEGDWDRVLAVNLKGVLFMVTAALPSMRSRRYGRIVLTSSVIGPITGNRGTTHYGATKAGMLGFMRSAALEVAQDGVTINAVLPGHIVTEGSRGNMSQEEMDDVARTIPAQRLGTPEDVGNAMLFLASDEAGYITGQTIVVDGGLVLPTYVGDVRRENAAHGF